MLTPEALDVLPVPAHQPWREAQDVRREPGFTTFSQWLPTENEPGLLVVQRWPGEPTMLSRSRSQFSRLDQIRNLGEVGMLPALEAVGLQLTAKVVRDTQQDVDTTLLALTTPPTEHFCDQATAFLARTHPTDCPEGPLVFKPYGNRARPHFTPYDLTTALANRTMLISRDGETGVHDILDHSVGWLGLPPAIVDYPQRSARQLLDGTAGETPAMRELTLTLEFGITTHLLHQIIMYGEEYGLWAELLGQPDTAALQSHLKNTREHVRTTADRLDTAT